MKTYYISDEEREEILWNHPYKITLLPSGIYESYYRGEDGKSHTLLHRNMRNMNEALVSIYMGWPMPKRGRPRAAYASDAEIEAILSEHAAPITYEEGAGWSTVINGKSVTKVRRYELEDMILAAHASNAHSKVEKHSLSISAERKAVLLEQHPYPIEQTKTGMYQTYLPRTDGQLVRRARKSLPDLEDVIANWYLGRDESAPEKGDFQELPEEERQAILSSYPRKIWRSERDEWCVNIDDGMRKYVCKSRKTRREIEDVIIASVKGWKEPSPYRKPDIPEEERARILQLWPYEIKERSDGRWSVQINTAPGRPSFRVRDTREDLEDVIVDAYLKGGTANILKPESVTNISAGERNTALERHPYAVSNISSGKWGTCLPDESSEWALKKFSSRKTAEDAVIIYQLGLYGPTLLQMFNEWNENRAAAARTITTTRGQFRKAFGRLKNRRVSSISEEEIITALTELADSPGSKAVFSCAKRIIRDVFRLAGDKGIPCADIEQILFENDIEKEDSAFIKGDESDLRFSEDEISVIKKFLLKKKKPTDTALLLLFDTGMRASEAAALKWSDFREGKIRISAAEYCDCESGERFIRDYPERGCRTVSVSEEVLRMLDALPQNKDGYLFTDEKTGERMSLMTISRRFGYISKLLLGRWCSPGKIRSTVAFQMLDAGCSPKETAAQLGVKNIDRILRFYT